MLTMDPYEKIGEEYLANDVEVVGVLDWVKIPEELTVKEALATYMAAYVVFNQDILIFSNSKNNKEIKLQKRDFWEEYFFSTVDGVIEVLGDIGAPDKELSDMTYLELYETYDFLDVEILNL